MGFPAHCKHVDSRRLLLLGLVYAGDLAGNVIAHNYHTRTIPKCIQEATQTRRHAESYSSDDEDSIASGSTLRGTTSSILAKIATTVDVDAQTPPPRQLWFCSLSGSTPPWWGEGG